MLFRLLPPNTFDEGCANYCLKRTLYLQSSAKQTRESHKSPEYLSLSKTATIGDLYLRLVRRSKSDIALSIFRFFGMLFQTAKIVGQEDGR